MFWICDQTRHRREAEERERPGESTEIETVKKEVKPEWLNPKKGVDGERGRIRGRGREERLKRQDK